MILPRTRLFVSLIRVLFLLGGRPHLCDLQRVSPLLLTLVADLCESNVACRFAQERMCILECATTQSEKLLFFIPELQRDSTNSVGFERAAQLALDPLGVGAAVELVAAHFLPAQSVLDTVVTHALSWIVGMPDLDGTQPTHMPPVDIHA
jgi:hypothetical protein